MAVRSGTRRAWPWAAAGGSCGSRPVRATPFHDVALQYHPGHTNRPWTEPDDWKLPAPNHLPRLTTADLERARNLGNRQEQLVGCLRRTHQKGPV